MILVFTLCSNNYLAQALVLGASLIKSNPGYNFKIGLVDRKSDQIAYSDLPFEVIEIEDIGLKGFAEMALRYNIVELNTSVKPGFFKYLFKKFSPDTIIYLDPDIEVFAPFNELEHEILDSDIVITPHFFTPINDDKWQAEEDFLNSGLYNLGFIAVKKTPNSFRMLDWWAERLRTKAFIDFKRGLFTDQIWINFVPLFFEKVKPFLNTGYNVAYWNLHERAITMKYGKYFVNGVQPLVFYHYASYRPLNPDIISSGQKRYTFNDRPDIVPLFTKYTELLFRNNYREWVNIPCHFVSVKETADREKRLKLVLEIPKYKRAIGKIIRLIIRKFGIVMDYSTLR